jgi:DNA excision repair protein ERCC-4
MSARPLRVVADERERASGVPDLLRKFGLQVEIRMLDIGDYIISPNCAIERKHARDFVKSLFSGRLFNQAHQLAESYSQRILIVEGDFRFYLREAANPRAYLGALATLSFQFGFHTFFTEDASQTAELIYTLTKRKDVVSREKGPLVKKKPKIEDIEKMQLFLVSSLPGIGPKLAHNLLKEFGTVRKVFAASKVELCKVEGVGRVKAERIVKFLDSPYCSRMMPPRQLALS